MNFYECFVLIIRYFQTDMPTLSEILKREFINNGKSKVYAAAELGVSERTIENYMHGKRFPKPDALVKLAKVLAFDLSELSDTEVQNVPRDAFPAVVQNGPTPYHKRRQDIKNRQEKPPVPIYGGFTTLGNITVYDDGGLKHRIVAEMPPDVFPGCDYGERAKGDSMYPLIMNQAILIGKTCPPNGIVYGEKYIIKTREGKDVAKFVHPGSKPGKLILKAYNKSIPDQEIQISDIVFACRVHWIINPT